MGAPVLDVGVESAFADLRQIVRVDDFGAAGDGRLIYDAAMNNGSAILTTGSSVFSASDVGKVIRVEAAGAAGASLAGYIQTFLSSTQVTLSVPAANTITGVQGKIACWGSDDTAPIQAAVNYLRYSGSAGHGNATLEFGDFFGLGRVYCVTDTILFGTSFDYGLITATAARGAVSGDVTAGGLLYHGISIRWLGADATSKPIFWFQEGSLFNIVERLGFFGGDEAIRFGCSTTAFGVLDSNTVRFCQFDSQATASLRFGFDISDSTHDASIFGCLVESCDFYRTQPNYGGHGVVANAATNGYNFTVRRCNFAMMHRLSAQAIVSQGMNNVNVDDTLFSYVGAPNGKYPVEAYSGSGWLNLSNCIFETPLVLKVDAWGSQQYTRGVTVRNVTVNDTNVDAKPAIDCSPAGCLAFLLVENTAVSTGAVQRTIAFGANSGLVITGISGAAQTDLYTGTYSIIGDGYNSKESRFAGPVQVQGGARVRSGTGAPGGVVVGSVGDLWLRTDGGAVSTLYVKESGNGTNAGWVAK